MLHVDLASTRNSYPLSRVENEHSRVQSRIPACICSAELHYCTTIRCRTHVIAVLHPATCLQQRQKQSSGYSRDNNQWKKTSSIPTWSFHRASLPMSIHQTLPPTTTPTSTHSPQNHPSFFFSPLPPISPPKLSRPPKPVRLTELQAASCMHAQSIAPRQQTIYASQPSLASHIQPLDTKESSPSVYTRKRLL